MKKSNVDFNDEWKNCKDLIYKGVKIGRKDIINKIIYKDHSAIVEKDRILIRPKKSIKEITGINRSHNVQVLVKSEIRPKEYRPSIGLSEKVCSEYEDWNVIVRVVFICEGKKKFDIRIIKKSVRDFKRSEYSSEWFNDFSGNENTQTNSKNMKKVKEDHQKFIPIENFEELSREESFPIILNNKPLKEETSQQTL